MTNTQCPFTTAIRVHLVPLTNMRTLARIVCCAHVASDVAAGCRVERALRNMGPLPLPHSGNLACYLDAIPFADTWVTEDGDIPDLDGLRELARAFLESTAARAA